MELNFSDFYDEQYPRVFNYVYYRLLNRADTEDVVSDIFFKALRNIKSFDGARASEATWLFRIASNTVSDYFRRRQKASGVALDDTEISVPDQASDELSHVEELQRLRECLEMLDDRTRSVLALRYWGEFSYAEIAVQTGLTEKNVSVILSRATTKLKKFF